MGLFNTVRDTLLIKVSRNEENKRCFEVIKAAEEDRTSWHLFDHEDNWNSTYVGTPLKGIEDNTVFGGQQRVDVSKSRMFGGDMLTPRGRISGRWHAALVVDDLSLIDHALASKLESWRVNITHYENLINDLKVENMDLSNKNRLLKRQLVDAEHHKKLGEKYTGKYEGILNKYGQKPGGFKK